MWFGVDAGAVDGAAARTSGVAERLAGVDLTGLGDGVRAAMPGARTSIAAVDDLLVLTEELSAVVARLADEGGRLRLAATQYAAADAVVRACAGTFPSPVLSPHSSTAATGPSR